MDFTTLRDARKAAGITQGKLAEMLGINRATISKYENGQIVPPLSQLEGISNALGISLSDFINLIGAGHDFQELSDGPNYPPIDIKKSPASVKADTGEISLDESNALLVALGYIKPGEQLSNEDLAFLSHIMGLLDTWFSKRQ